MSEQPKTKAAIVQQGLRSIMPQVVNNLPSEDKAAARRILGGAYQCLVNDPRALDLAAQNPQGLFMQILGVAQMGWTLGPTMSSDAHILRFGNRLQAMPNYRGLVKSAYQGGITSIQTGCVRDGDTFDYSLGTEPFIQHKLSPDPEEDRPVTHAWAAIYVGDEGKPIVTVLTRAQIEKVRNASMGKNAMAWTQWYEEQAKKTALKRALKLAPRSEKLAQALAMDDGAETGKPLEVADFDIMEDTQDVHASDDHGTLGARCRDGGNEE